ncbi:MAG: hypothetical protein ACJ779_00720 [Chloroflexota bacterium]
MSIARLLASIVIALVLAGCGSSGASTSSPAAAASAQSTAAATPARSNGPKPSQTDTDWGRIWDELPASFPRIPAATPEEQASGGATSGVLVVEGVDAKGAATALQTALQKAGYTTVGSLDPLEDGSVVLDMTGPPAGCMVQATATPTGAVTTVRILYGAECPFD